MKTLTQFLKYRKHDTSHGFLTVELANGSELVELNKLILPVLQPITPGEIARFFSSKEFAVDIEHARELTNSEDEAVLNIIRWAYPDSFYGSAVTPNNGFYTDTRRDRVTFFNLHSHPLGYSYLPSDTDLRVLNTITEETRRMLESEKEFGYLPEDFDSLDFRPILGTGSFWGPLDNYNNIFELLLLQWKREATETDFSEKRIEEYKRLVGGEELLDYLKTLPYNLAVLRYVWDPKKEGYVMEKGLNELGMFASKNHDPSQMEFGF